MARTSYNVYFEIHEERALVANRGGVAGGSGTRAAALTIGSGGPPAPT
jgi:hypothetical protein